MIGPLSPGALRRFNLCATILWLAMIPAAIWLGWVESVPFISALSLYAIVVAHFSAYQASRAEEEAAK